MPPVKYNVVETKVKSFQAKNGLSLEINERNKTVTVRLNGVEVCEKSSISSLLQAAKMLQKMRPDSKFVCDVHGSYIREEGSAQSGACPECLVESLAHARRQMPVRAQENSEDA